MAQPAASTAATAAPASDASVPRLIKFNGILRDLAGKPLTGPVDVTFALYSQQAGGEPLWFETQTVLADSLGNYTVLLGSMTPQGVPMELFTSSEAHWLGVQVENLPEQPRVLLLSVPYALKAGDAETLGGKPASAYMLVPENGSQSASSGTSTDSMSGVTGTNTTTSNSLLTTGTAALATVTGTQNYIPMFTDNSGSLGNSLLYQTGGNVGIGTTSPSSLLTVVSSGAPLPVVNGAPTMAKFASPQGTVPWALRQNGSAAGGYGVTLMWFETADGGVGTIAEKPLGALMVGGVTGNGLALAANGATQMFINTSGNVGVGTMDPTLGGKVSPRFTIVPRAGGATALAAGYDATHPNFALNVNGTAGTWTMYDYAAGGWQAGLSQSAGKVGIGTATPTTKLDVAGNIHASGSVAATSFSGDGSGLTNVTASTATTAGSLNCTGCVGNTQLGINYAASTTQGGDAANALMLGGVAPSGYALASGDTNYIANESTAQTADLDITGSGTFGGAVSAATAASTTTLPTPGALPPAGVEGQATATSNYAAGVVGSASSASGAGVYGASSSGFGVVGATEGTSDTAVGVNAMSLATTGNAAALEADVNSATGIAGNFESSAAGALLLKGSVGPSGSRTQVFSVDTSGNVTASGTFTGNGSGLTNITATSSTSADSLNCTGCVGNTQLGINYAASTTQGGDATNALMLGGVAPSGYAAVGANTFTATQTISTGDVSLSAGNLDLPATNSTGTAGVINLGGNAFLHGFGGTSNTFVGVQAGNFNGTNTGTGNTSAGFQALFGVTSGGGNVAVGEFALKPTTTGANNSAVGAGALGSNSTGSNNTAIGQGAGFTTNGGNANTSGTNNTFVGFAAGPSTSTQLTNATAVGSNAAVGEDNALVLGSISGTNGATASVDVGIGTATPAHTLDVVGDINASTNINAGGNLTVTGTITGNGSGLTNVTSSGLTCTGCVTTADLGSGTVTGTIIASGTITGTNVSSTADIAPTAITGTAATLGANTFTAAQTVSSGDVSINSGNLNVGGVITLGGEQGARRLRV